MVLREADRNRDGREEELTRYDGVCWVVETGPSRFWSESPHI